MFRRNTELLQNRLAQQYSQNTLGKCLWWGYSTSKQPQIMMLYPLYPAVDTVSSCWYVVLFFSGCCVFITNNSPIIPAVLTKFSQYCCAVSRWFLAISCKVFQCPYSCYNDWIMSVAGVLCVKTARPPLGQEPANSGIGGGRSSKEAKTHRY